ncbi:hypothetical protein IW261DRAFT_922569 [Armillaria novae-zelandiae]|uniref:Uncharacterized protein n=1 Tax=Armillaria novae-zelandiae TaxID=153914 RepID=A0AA39TZG8_9AGAR|nr:hypothetical protein IW261DRAFT_922569 [Armillaria novae-zelandiae]
MLTSRQSTVCRRDDSPNLDERLPIFMCQRPGNRCRRWRHGRGWASTRAHGVEGGAMEPRLRGVPPLPLSWSGSVYCLRSVCLILLGRNWAQAVLFRTLYTAMTYPLSEGFETGSYCIHRGSRRSASINLPHYPPSIFPTSQFHTCTSSSPY